MLKLDAGLCQIILAVLSPLRFIVRSREVECVVIDEQLLAEQLNPDGIMRVLVNVVEPADAPLASLGITASC